MYQCSWYQSTPSVILHESDIEIARTIFGHDDMQQQVADTGMVNDI